MMYCLESHKKIDIPRVLMGTFHTEEENDEILQFFNVSYIQLNNIQRK